MDDLERRLQTLARQLSNSLLEHSLKGPEQGFHIRQGLKIVPSTKVGLGWRNVSAFSNLPPNIICIIQTFIGSHNDISLRLTCRGINMAIETNPTLSYYLQSEDTFTRLLEGHIKSRFAHLIGLTILLSNRQRSGCRAKELSLAVLASSLPQLESLVVAVRRNYPTESWHARDIHPSNEFFDIPNHRQSTAKPMPRLRSIVIDCEADWIWNEPMLPFPFCTLDWQIPTVLFENGNDLRRCTLRNIAWPWNVLYKWTNLQVLTYCANFELRADVFDDIAHGLPQLISLRLECTRFSPPDLTNVKGYFIDRSLYQLRHLLLTYCLRRMAVDVVLRTIRRDYQAPAGYLPPNPVGIFCREGGLCLIYGPEDRRIRLAGQPLVFMSTIFRDVLRILSLSHVTALGVHEYIASRLCNDFGLTGEPEPSGSGRNAHVTTFPALQIFTIWMASCFDTSYSHRAPRTPLNPLFLERTLNINARFPQLAILQFSCGERREEYHMGGIQCPSGWNCSMRNGYTIFLRDIHTFVLDCGFSVLEQINICGIECVDVDLATALAELQQLVPVVDFWIGQVWSDVNDSNLERLCDADSVFEEMEGR
ncbi:hypothetical protein BKA62DRAFT_720188 [Auriculariales sp. MPI-PUGE-AT-0066]|nr:hypothetical protein BKA62DRAFT_720188 [Auriculariales sp. MPI-PUGE-AT-0066]